MTKQPTYEELKNRISVLEGIIEKKGDKKYRILFEKSKDAILIIKNQIFVDCNQATIDMLGYKNKSELLDTHPSELSPEIQPDGRDSFSKAIEMMDIAIKNGSHRFEWNHRKSNGDIFPVEVLLTTISKKESNQVIHTIWRDISNRKEAEKALLQNQKRLSAHLQNTPVGAVSWDLNFRAIEWNPAAESIFGYSKKEAIGKHATELILPSDQKKLVDGVFQELLAGKGGERSVNENITKKGRRIHCDWYNTVIKNVDGNIVGVASLVNDITERKHSEDINKTLFAISNAVNIATNLDDLYKEVHRLLSEVINVRNFFIAIVSEKNHTLYFPYYADTVDEDFSPITDFDPKDSLTGLVVSKRKPILLKHRKLKALSRKDGVWGPVPVIWMGVPLMIKNEVIGVIAVQSYTDPDLYNEYDLKVLSSISDQIAIAIDRKRTEDELRESEKRYRHLYNNAPSGMYEINFVERKFTEVNDVFIKYSGYSEKELLSMNPFDLLTKESKRRFIKMYDKLLNGKRTSNDAEYEIIGKNGQILSVILNSDYIYENNKLKGARVVAHNITERKKIENMIIQSEKMMSVGGLAAGMAHEINNPLAGMMQNSQVIRNRLTQTIKANIDVAKELGTTMTVIKQFMEKRGIIDQLESINKAGIQAAKIIENMLSFAKKSDSNRSKNRLNELIDKTIELARNDYDLKKNYDFKQIEIIRDYNSNTPPILCEASKIQQVLFNVIKNASEAMHQASEQKITPKIVFRLKKQSKLVCLEIEDNGPGIDYQTQKRIFEPFFTTKNVDKGTGLGLSVSYFIIVNDHKGKMEVDSTPGNGTKFIIKLPIK